MGWGRAEAVSMWYVPEQVTSPLGLLSSATVIKLSMIMNVKVLSSLESERLKSEWTELTHSCCWERNGRGRGDAQRLISLLPLV